MEDVSLDIRRLPVGDYQADDRLLFERKTLGDFAISVIDGNFFRQMTKLAIAPLKGVLILEGSSRDLQRIGVRREALQGALIATSMTLGIPVLRSMEPGETARLMVYAARQIKLAAAGGLHRSGYRPKGKRKRQLYILQGLPGVGPKRAARLLDRFGSIQDIINASLEKLTSVNGIGQSTKH
ncbi:MAG: nuclease [Desulfosarcina sp.]|nr:nuclease [Desulfosarcina sp.]